MSTILICDDEKDIVSALEIYLRAEAFIGWAVLDPSVLAKAEI